MEKVQSYKNECFKETCAGIETLWIIDTAGSHKMVNEITRHETFSRVCITSKKRKEIHITKQVEINQRWHEYFEVHFDDIEEKSIIQWNLGS